LLPISFFSYKKLKKQNQDKNNIDDDEDLEDVL
jgi:CDP-diacylglycerol--serine O-phosphatidyltransferase